jgi:hypothetical protein
MSSAATISRASRDGWVISESRFQEGLTEAEIELGLAPCHLISRLRRAVAKITDGMTRLKKLEKIS